MNKILKLQSIVVESKGLGDTPLSTTSIVCKLESTYSLFTCPVSPED